MILVRDDNSKKLNEKLGRVTRQIMDWSNYEASHGLDSKCNAAIKNYTDDFTKDGGKPAVVLAYIIGTIDGIEKYIGCCLDKEHNEQLPLSKTFEYLKLARREASAIIRNL